jgi:hypothetical protein
VKHLVWHGNHALTASPSTASPAPSTIFRPRRSRSYCSNVELDFNLHKSNSTFYADLDVSRIELLVILFKDAITPLSPRATLSPESAYSSRNRRKQLIAALGGVTCLYRREIKPYQRYEVVSRVLTWDEKWLYIVSYFVKPSGRTEAEITEDRILASAVSRYVFKQGRQTMQPTEVLRNLGLLPDEAEAKAAANNAAAYFADDAAAMPERPPLPRCDLVNGSGHIGGEPDSWTWTDVEVERKRGLAIAGHMTGLNGLQDLAASTTILG